MQKIKFNTYLSLCTKVHINWITDIIIRYDTLKLFKDVESSNQNTGTFKEFPNNIKIGNTNS